MTRVFRSRPLAAPEWTSLLERRTSNRYQLCLPALFSWSDLAGAVQKEGGFTHDINPSGIYVISRSCPPVGTEIDLEVFLLFDGGSRGRRSATLAGRMRVVRVQEDDGKQGFAAAGELNFMGGEDPTDVQTLS